MQRPVLQKIGATLPITRTCKILVKLEHHSLLHKRLYDNVMRQIRERLQLPDGHELGAHRPVVGWDCLMAEGLINELDEETTLFPRSRPIL